MCHLVSIQEKVKKEKRMFFRRPKKESVVDVIKDMALGHLGVHSFGDRRGPVTISRYACGSYRECSPEAMLQMPIPPEFVERIQQNTRRFAKRQLTWLRKLPVEWLPVCGQLDSARLAGEILARVRSV